MKVCKTCRQQTKNKVYCSKQCQYQGYKIKKINKIILNCDNCQEQIEKIPSKIRKKNYCSRGCSDLHKKKVMIGKNNPMYGKKANEETLKKKSDKMRGLWKDENYKEKVINARIKAMEGRDYWFGNTPEQIEKRKKSLIENLYGMSYDEYMITVFIEKEKYYREVWKVTNKQPIDLLENADKRARICQDECAFHLDHIVPIIHGFENKISPDIIGNISNLRFIPAYENIKKGRKIE